LSNLVDEHVGRSGGSVLVSDGGRLVQFDVDDGRYLSTLLGDDSSERWRRDGRVEVRGWC